MTGSDWYRSSRGGLSRYFSDLYAALRDTGAEDVTVAAAALGEPDPGGRAWRPRRGGAAGTIGRVRASRRPPDHPVDVLDRHFALYGPPARGAALVTHFHGPWALESAAAGERRTAVALKRCIERARYRGTDRFVVLSAHFGRLLTEQYGADPGLIHVIPPGVDLDRFRVRPIPDGSPRVLAVRRLERRMGLDVLLRAWPAVVDAVPGARLDVVGTGPLADELRRMIDDLRIGDTAALLGAVDDDRLSRAYRDAAVTVVPTRALEGFGLIALESLATGRAPVVTEVGGLPDSVRDLAPDLVVPAADPDALASRLVRALEGDRPDPAACRAHAERFSWRAAAERHLALYRELR